MPSNLIQKGTSAGKTLSGLIKAVDSLANLDPGYEKKPDGVWGSRAVIRCGNLELRSEELDFDFTVSFDDDLEANETEITVYNLSRDSASRIRKDLPINISAGYGDDTGILFSGTVNRVRTRHESPDVITVINCLDDTKDHTVESIAFSAGTSASYILRQLLDKTGLPVAVFQPRRDYVYENEQTVDGDLMAAIKKYAQVCGVSSYVLGGKVFCRYLKEGDNIGFTVCEETGMIGSPEPFEEEETAEDFSETVNGYTVKMLLQHRIKTAAIIDLRSVDASGRFRVRKGTHTFQCNGEALTEIEVI